MKTKLLISTVVFALTVAHNLTIAQSWQWAKKVGGSNSDFGNSVATDTSGYIYVTGGFLSSTIAFDTTNLTNANTGTQDFFIAKYDSMGTVLWAKKSGGTGGDVGNSIATDKKGNIYVTGSFNSLSITFDTVTVNNTNTSDDVFIVKFNSAGSAIWARKAGGTFSDKGYNIATDSSGNVFVTGIFSSSSITFGSTTLTNTNPGSNNVFIAKYDSSGNALWARGAGGSASDDGYGVSSDINGNCYVTGDFSSSSITFGSTTLNQVANGDIFIVKYNSAGTVLWAKSIGGSGNDIGRRVITDKQGNLYVTGYFNSSSISFGSFNFSTAGNWDIYLTKYDSLGNVLWAKKSGGINGDISNAITIDKSGNVYIGGYFNSSSLTFGNITVPNATPSQNFSDIFLATYNPAGNAIWAVSVGGTDNEYGNSIAIDPHIKGNAYLTGNFRSSPISFGSNTLTSAGADDFYLSKLGFPPLASFSVSNDTICAGGCINFSDQSIKNPTTWSWTFAGGTPSTSTLQNPNNICYSTAGTYTVTLVATNNIGSDSATQTIIVQTCTGIQEENNLRTVTIFPNPFSTQTVLHTDNLLINATLTVDNCFGQTVAQIKNISGQTIIFNRDNLASGLYFVRLTEKNKVIAVDKLVITDK